MARICTISEVQSFERSALPGMTLVYYISQSGAADFLVTRLGERTTPDLRRVINVIRRMSNDGYIDLVQARVGKTVEYRAIWRTYRLGVSARHEPLEMVA